MNIAKIKGIIMGGHRGITPHEAQGLIDHIEELEAELKEAKTEIERLMGEIAEFMKDPI